MKQAKIVDWRTDDPEVMNLDRVETEARDQLRVAESRLAAAEDAAAPTAEAAERARAEHALGRLDDRGLAAAVKAREKNDRELNHLREQVTGLRARLRHLGELRPGIEAAAMARAAELLIDKYMSALSDLATKLEEVKVVVRRCEKFKVAAFQQFPRVAGCPTIDLPGYASETLGRHRRAFDRVERLQINVADPLRIGASK
jgi:hypothetical protein